MRCLSFLHVLHGNEYSNTYIQKQFFSIDQLGFDMWDGLWLISPCSFCLILYTTQNVDTHFVIISLMIFSRQKEISWTLFLRTQMFGQEWELDESNGPHNNNRKFSNTLNYTTFQYTLNKVFFFQGKNYIPLIFIIS